MTGTPLVDIKDDRLRRTIEWLILELNQQDYGEITVNIKKHEGKITSIEKTIKQKEHD